MQKTVYMNIMPTALRNVHVPSMFINNKMLDMVDEHKYLGVFIKSTYSDVRDIKRQIRSTYARGNMLINKFRKCNDEVKIQLFKSYCTSLYCCTLWSNFSLQEYSRLRTAYNNIFRSLMHVDRRSSVSKAFIDTGIDCFNVIVRKNIFSLRNRLMNSNNVIVKAVMSSRHFLLGSRISARWHKLLF